VPRKLQPERSILEKQLLDNIKFALGDKALKQFDHQRLAEIIQQPHLKRTLWQSLC
jgi:hypothetical protein